MYIGVFGLFFLINVGLLFEFFLLDLGFVYGIRLFFFGFFLLLSFLMMKLVCGCWLGGFGVVFVVFDGDVFFFGWIVGGDLNRDFMFLILFEICVNFLYYVVIFLNFFFVLKLSCLLFLLIRLERVLFIYMFNKWVFWWGVVSLLEMVFN